MRILASLAFALCAAAPLAAPFAAQAASPPELIAKGEYVARLGDCVACHSVAGQPPFSGGLKMATPLGAITTTNITPDKATGIGDYSFDDFKRAMQQGVARDGHHLYPAMPYPSYAKVSDDDLQALYAFFMESVPAVDRPNAKSEIPPPLNWRWPLTFWNVIFSAKPGFTPDPAHDAAWNRGAYLVEGLGHCGACHTPRGLFFQEKGLDHTHATFVSGGNLDNWFASSLRSDPLAGLGSWSIPDIAALLKTGHNSHATAYGTMIDAINNSTQYMSDDDLTGIATYLKSLPGNESETKTAAAPDDHGAKIYAQQCAFCHLADGKGQAPYLPPLAGNPTMSDADPASLINITLNGSSRIVVSGMPDAYRMPEFRVLLKDDDIADVVSFIRQSWGNQGSAVTADQVAKIRKQSDPASDTVVILRMR